jgi:serine/threonine protein kinase
MNQDLPPLGSTVGPWHVLTRLDSGSFGVVYRAQRAGHPDSPPVALKVAKRPKDPRFEREAELLQLDIPGAPRFEDEGLWTAPSGERYPYVVMELVQGFTLYNWFQGGRTSREVLAQVAGALASAHSRGAVHRDVKGDNIRVTPEGRAVLVDWGSGWFSGARPLTDTVPPPGTTSYRPPEQRAFSYRFRMDSEARWHAQPTDDLYSLGVAFYRCVTGLYLTPLSEGGEVASSREVLLPSIYCTLSLELEALLLRLLANEREQRGTAAQLAREAMALAENGGEETDKPIVLTASAEPTDSGGPCSDGLDDEEELSDTDTGSSTSTGTSSTGPTRSRKRTRRREAVRPDWEARALAAFVGGFLVAIVMLLAIVLGRNSEPATRWEEPPQEVAQFAPDAGVAEESLSSVQAPEKRVGPWILALGRPMPSKPHPDQRRPPCGRGETEINGGCWVKVADQSPPCGNEMFDYAGACYFASFAGPKTPTSGEP